MIDRIKPAEGGPAQPLRPVRDMSGLSVQDASGLHIGKLWGALAEQETGLIRYLDISLTDQPRHVLVPIGHARVYDYQQDTEVRLRAALLEELQDIPAFDPDSRVDEQLERDVLHAHGRLFHGERYYAHPAFDHRGLYAGEHPIARADDADASDGLRQLRELRGYRVARGEADIRGWELHGEDEPLGTVGDLIVDPDTEQVRYIVLERAGPPVLLPIGFLRIEAEAERVLAPGLLAPALDHLPAYEGGEVDRADEEALREALADSFTGRRRYQLPDFREIRG